MQWSLRSSNISKWYSEGLEPAVMNTLKKEAKKLITVRLIEAIMNNAFFLLELT